MFFTYKDVSTGVTQIQTCHALQVNGIPSTTLMLGINLTDCSERLETSSTGTNQPITIYIGSTTKTCNYENYNIWSNGINNTHVVKLAADCITGSGEPLAVDPNQDDDAWTLSQELAYGTNPFKSDTDGDGIMDHLDPDPLNKPSTTCSNTVNPILGGEVVFSTSSSCIATESITTQPRVSVSTGANVVFKAPKITLGDGFSVKAGGLFSAGQNTTTIFNKTVVEPTTEEQTLISSKTSTSSTESTNISGSIYLTQKQLPSELKSILDKYKAIAHDIFSDANGDHIVFTTDSGLLSTDQNSLYDVYLYDVQHEVLSIISLNDSGYSANGASYQPQIDGGGNYIVYTSEAGDIIKNDTNAVSDIYFYTIALGLTERVSMGSDGSQAYTPAKNPVIASKIPLVLYDRVNESGKNRIYRYDYNWPNLYSTEVLQETGVSETALDRHHPAISQSGHYLAYLASDPTHVTTSCIVTIYDQIADSLNHATCPDTLFKSDEGINYYSIDEDGKIVVWQ